MSSDASKEELQVLTSPAPITDEVEVENESAPEVEAYRWIQNVDGVIVRELWPNGKPLPDGFVFAGVNNTESILQC